MSPLHRVDERRCQVRRVIFRWQRAQRRRTLWRQRAVRTAKPCGPGRRCYGQVLADAASASTGAVLATFAKAREARRNSAPGRARHKPSDHRAGKAVCWASPVCCCAVFCVCVLRSRPRVRCQHPAFPVPSWLPEGGVTSKARAKWRAVRTAKPCGPGRRCYGQALADAAVASTGAVPATSAGAREARRKVRLPGEHGISCPTIAQGRPSDRHHLYAAVRFFLRVHFAQRTAGALSAPGLPCALLDLRVERSSKARAIQAARTKRHVCESSYVSQARYR